MDSKGSIFLMVVCVSGMTSLVYMMYQEQKSDKEIIFPYPTFQTKLLSFNSDTKSALKQRRLSLLETALKNMKSNFDTFLKKHKIPIKKKASVCEKYRLEGSENKMILANIWNEVNDVRPDDVTFVTQMSLSKLPEMLSRVVEHWTGPISAAVYLHIKELQHFHSVIVKMDDLFERNNVNLHLVAKSGNLYPTNLLRNVALNNSLTEGVFLSDVDFAPSYGSHDHIAKLVRSGALHGKKVLVIPAFEFKGLNKSFEYPKNKIDLISLWTRGKVQQFHKGFRQGHGPTNYKQWKKSNTSYKVFHKGAYEPYIVGNRTELPHYSQTFLGRYLDKISHLYSVARNGFSFHVLPEIFTIHYPHKSTGAGNYAKCASEAFIDLRKFYESKSDN